MLPSRRRLGSARLSAAAADIAGPKSTRGAGEIEIWPMKTFRRRHRSSASGAIEFPPPARVATMQIFIATRRHRPPDRLGRFAEFFKSFDLLGRSAAMQSNEG